MNKQKMKQWITATLLSAVLLVVGVFSGFTPFQQESVVSAATNRKLVVKYLNVDGDSTLMQYTSASGATTTILVDTGEQKGSSSDGLYLIDKLDVITNNETSITLSKKNGKYVIDYVFITHPHADHIGGLYDVLSSGKYVVENLYFNKTCYADVDNAAVNKSKALITTNVNINNKVPMYAYNTSSIQTISIDGGNLNIKVFPAYKEYTGSKNLRVNNSSMLVKMVYKNSANKEINYVFAGDIFAEAMKDIYNDGGTYRSQLVTTGKTYLKLAHHASRRATISNLWKDDYKNRTAGSIMNKVYGVGDNVGTSKPKDTDYYYVLENENNEKIYYEYTFSKSLALYKVAKGKTDKISFSEGNKTMVAYNYDQRFNSLFATNSGAGNELIGIGNIKAESDALTFLAFEGLDEYHDVNSKEYINDNLNLVDKCNCSAIYSSLKSLIQSTKSTYTVTE